MTLLQAIQRRALIDINPVHRNLGYSRQYVLIRKGIPQSILLWNGIEFLDECYTYGYSVNYAALI
jgi:hypothetical protein